MSIFNIGLKSESTALPGAVTEIAAVRGGPAGHVITAVRTAEKNLKLITWRARDTGITKLADSGTQAGRASSIDIAKGNKVVTALRTEDGDLKLISWSVDSNGNISRAGDSGDKAGAATAIKIIAVNTLTFVTACRAGNGRLLLISWRLNSNGGFTRLADSGSAGDTISEVAIVKLSPTLQANRLVTPIIDAAGNLKVIFWTMTDEGRFTRVSDSGVIETQATTVRAAVDLLNRVVISVFVSPFAKLIRCRVLDNGTVLKLSDSGTTGGVDVINSLGAFSNGFVATAKGALGAPLLVSWSLNPNGTIVRRADCGSQEDDASIPCLIPNAGVVGLTMITAAKTSGGSLKLAGWGQAVVRLHTKVVREPDIAIDTMVQNMIQVYNTVGIRVEHVSTETLDLDDTFLDIDVGGCTRGSTTTEQDELFQNRNNAGPNDIVVYFVRSTDPILNGCATFPPGRPGAVVSAFASQWTLAHEVGHVLGLGHVDDNDRLMTGNGTGNITNPPPDLIASEASRMQSSAFTV